MKECISIINQKGGVGKSTTVNAIGAGLYRSGYKVLYVDLDPQGNLSYCMKATGSENTSADILTGRSPIKDCIVHTDQGDLVPSSPMLTSADIILQQNKDRKEKILQGALKPIEREYDYVIIDTPPALGFLTLNALTASTSALIPAQADIFSLQGIGQLSQTIDAVKKVSNRDLVIKGILITRYNGRTILTRDLTELLEDTAEMLGTKVFNTKIRECTALKESQAVQQDIFTYSPKCNGAVDYQQLIDEITGENENDKFSEKI